MSEPSSSSSSSDSESGEDAQAIEENSAETSQGNVSSASSPVPEETPEAAQKNAEVEEPAENAPDKENSSSPTNPEQEQEAPALPETRTDNLTDDLFQKESSSDDSDIEQRKKLETQNRKDSSDSDGPQIKEGEQEDEEKSRKSGSASPAGFQAAEEDLFGDAADLSSSDEEVEKKAEEKKGEEEEFNADDIVGPRMYIEEEEQESRAPPAETVINVEAPRINADLGNQIHFVKFPNFLSVEPRVFDAETYEDEIDEDEVLDEEGRSRLKLKVENTIRWRNSVDDEGNPSKESNAKIVRWSDGTMSLYLGSEIFDVHLQPTVGDHNHLFVRQGQGLQGQAVFRTKLTFRPHSTDTLTHRKMTLSMADRSSKAQKVKVLAEVGTDPETQKQELVRKEEERLRASARREASQRRIREKGVGRGLSTGFLEDRDEDSDEGGESLAAIKRSYKPGGRDFDKTVKGLEKTYGGDSDSDDSEEGRSKLRGAKNLDSDEDEDAEDKEVPLDSPAAEARASKKRRMIEDSDED